MVVVRACMVSHESFCSCINCNNKLLCSSFGAAIARRVSVSVTERRVFLAWAAPVKITKAMQRGFKQINTSVLNITQVLMFINSSSITEKRSLEVAA